MADLYKDALPVVVVPEGTVTGPEVLFDSPLPVVIVGGDSEGGGGGSTEIPARLGAKAKDVTGSSLEDLVDNGWYWASSVTEGNFGPDGIVIHVTSAANGQVHQLITTSNGSASARTRNTDGTWGDFRQAFDADGAVDKWLREQLRNDDGTIGGGGSFELPGRLAAELPDTGHTGMFDDIDETGWYYSSTAKTIYGTNRPAFAHVIVGPAGGSRIVQVYDILSQTTWQKARQADGVTWNSWLQLSDQQGAADGLARDQMRYADRQYSNVLYAAGDTYWNNLDGRTGVIDLNLSGDAEMQDLAEWGNSDSAIELTVIVRQDPYTGGAVVIWPSNLVWAGGNEPVLSTAAGAVDIVKLLGTSTGWVGYGVGPTYLA